jgi:hypothetical protein
MVFKNGHGKTPFLIWIISKLVDRRIDKSLARARSETRLYEKEKAVCAARLGGISLFINPLLPFRRAQRGREKRSSEEGKTPPPQLRRDTCLRIASKMAFLPGP